MNNLEAAIDAAISEMPEDFVIRSFLLSNKAEVKRMCITEYDEEKVMNQFREEGKAEGRVEGRAEGRAEGKAEGKKEGESNLASLIVKLKELGRIEDAFKAASDPAFRAKLYREFSIA